MTPGTLVAQEHIRSPHSGSLNPLRRPSPGPLDPEKPSVPDQGSNRDPEPRQRNVLRRKSSKNYHSPPSRSPSRALDGSGPMAVGNSHRLTPAGAVAQAYKLQEKQETPSHMDISSTTSGWVDNYDDDEKNAMPYYTVLGATTGRVVAVGSAADSTSWAPDPPSQRLERKTSSQLLRKPSQKQLASGSKSVPATISKATVSGFISPSSPNGITTSFPPQSPQSGGDNSPSPSTSSGGKIWKLMKRMSTGGLRDKYTKSAEQDTPPPVPALPSLPLQPPRTAHRDHSPDPPRREQSDPAPVQIFRKASFRMMRSASEMGHGNAPNHPSSSRSQSDNGSSNLPAFESLYAPIGMTPPRPGRLAEQYNSDMLASSSSSNRSGKSHRSKSQHEQPQRPITVDLKPPSSSSSSRSTSLTPAKRRPATITVPSRSSSATVTGTTPKPTRKKPSVGNLTDDGHYFQSSRHDPIEERRRPSTSNTTASSNASVPPFLPRSASGSTTNTSVYSHVTKNTTPTSGFSTGGYHSSGSKVSLDDASNAMTQSLEALERPIISEQERTRVEAQLELGSRKSDSDSRSITSHPPMSPRKRRELELVVQTHLPAHLPAPPRPRRPRETTSDVDSDAPKPQRAPPRRVPPPTLHTGYDELGLPIQSLDRKPARTRRASVGVLTDTEEEQSAPASPLIPEFSTDSAINTFGPRSRLNMPPPSGDSELPYTREESGSRPFAQPAPPFWNSSRPAPESSESESEVHRHPRHHSHHSTSSSHKPTFSLKKRPSLKSLLLPMPKSESALPTNSNLRRRDKNRPATALPTVGTFELSAIGKRRGSGSTASTTSATPVSSVVSPGSYGPNLAPPARPPRSAARPPPSPGQSPRSSTYPQHPPHPYSAQSLSPDTPHARDGSGAVSGSVSDIGHGTSSSIFSVFSTSSSKKAKHARRKTELANLPRPRSNSLGDWQIPLPSNAQPKSPRKRPITSTSPIPISDTPVSRDLQRFREQQQQQQRNWSKSMDTGRPKLPPASGHAVSASQQLNFRALTREVDGGRKLSEAEKNKKWDDLLKKSDKAGGTLHLWAGRDQLGEVEGDAP